MNTWEKCGPGRRRGRCKDQRRSMLDETEGCREEWGHIVWGLMSTGRTWVFVRYVVERSLKSFVQGNVMILFIFGNDLSGCSEATARNWEYI